MQRDKGQRGQEHNAFEELLKISLWWESRIYGKRMKKPIDVNSSWVIQDFGD